MPSADDATGVSVRGARFSFVSASGPGSYVHGTGIWTIGTITSGSSAMRLITAKMIVVGAASNTAEVWTSDEPNPNSTPGNGVVGENDEATAALTVTAAPTPPVTANGSPIVPADPQNSSGVLLLGGLVMAFAVAAGSAYRSRRRSIRHAGWTPRRR
jgi:hypothetical protein